MVYNDDFGLFPPIWFWSMEGLQKNVMLERSDSIQNDVDPIGRYAPSRMTPTHMINITFLSGLDPAFNRSADIPKNHLVLLTTKQIEKLRELKSAGWQVNYFDRDFVLLRPPS